MGRSIRRGDSNNNRDSDRCNNQIHRDMPRSPTDLRHEIQCIIAGLLVLALFLYLLAAYLGIETNMVEKVIDNMIILLTAIAFYYFSKYFGRNGNGKKN